MPSKGSPHLGRVLVHQQLVEAGGVEDLVGMVRFRRQDWGDEQGLGCSHPLAVIPVKVRLGRQDWGDEGYRVKVRLGRQNWDEDYRVRVRCCTSESKHGVRTCILGLERNALRRDETPCIGDMQERRGGGKESGQRTPKETCQSKPG